VRPRLYQGSYSVRRNEVRPQTGWGVVGPLPLPYPLRQQAKTNPAGRLGKVPGRSRTRIRTNTTNTACAYSFATDICRFAHQIDNLSSQSNGLLTLSRRSASIVRRHPGSLGMSSGLRGKKPDGIPLEGRPIPRCAPCLNGAEQSPKVISFVLTTRPEWMEA